RAGPLMSWDARLLLFFSSRRRHTRSKRDWSSDVCSSDRLVSLRWFVGGRRGRRHHPRQRCRRRLPTLVVQVLMVGGTLFAPCNRAGFVESWDLVGGVVCLRGVSLPYPVWGTLVHDDVVNFVRH